MLLLVLNRTSVLIMTTGCSVSFEMTCAHMHNIEASKSIGRNYVDSVGVF